MRLVNFGLVSLALATAMHLDWHAARPAVHHLSLGWPWHWLLAVPAGALTAWYVTRAWPARPVAVTLGILGIASVLAAVVEPAWEYWVDGAPYEWAFGSSRLAAFAMFVAAGTVTHVIVMIVARRRMLR
jgi:hypothetical protein